MKRISTSLLLVLAITASFLIGCDEKPHKENKKETERTADNTVDIPEWQNRRSDVGTINEISKMNDTYIAISNQIKTNPKDYASRLKMADLFIVEARATGNYNHYYPAAVQMIDGVLKENPSNKDDLFRAYTSKAVILLSLHKFVEAKEMGEKALAINANNSRVYGILTDAHLELGNYTKAVEMADSMVAKRPDLRSYSRVSYLREVHGDVEGAKKAMELAVKAGYPGHEETAWAQVTLGSLYENYGDLTSAEQLYQLALQERKKYPFAIKGLASVEMKKGNYDSSLMLINKAIKIRPEPSFYEELAYINYHKEDQEAFEKSKEKAFKMLRGLNLDATSKNNNAYAEKDHSHNNDSHSHGNESHSHGDDSHSHGDDSHAHGEDDHSHEKNNHDDENTHGHSHETGLEMANLYLNLTDNTVEAKHHALHEYAIRPNNIEVNTALAKVYYNEGKYDLAMEHFKKARITQSKEPELLLIGGLIHVKSGKTGKGKQLIDEAMKLNPYMKSKYVTEAKAVEA